MKTAHLIFVFFVLILLCFSVVSAVPANPRELTVTQPDGEELNINIIGDENFAWAETEEGYTVIQNDDGYWVYAEKVSGDLVPTELIAGKDKPLEKKHLSPVFEKENSVYSKSSPAPARAAVIGTEKIVVLLINFTDTAQNPSHTKAYFENLFFNSSNPNSLWAYYNENSYGQLNISGEVYGWFASSRNQSYYGKDGVGGCGSESIDSYYTCIYNLAKDAVTVANASVDFSQYDANSDGYIDHLLVVHSGSAQENGGGTNSIWSHRWDILPNGVTVDGVKAKGYTTVSENSPIGTVAHEFGHDIGLPDLYDADGSGSGGTSDGVGDWCIMGTGSWNGASAGTSPAQISAWGKYLLGWINPTIVKTKLTAEIKNVERNNDSVYMIINSTKTAGNFSDTGGTQYFLIENRQQLGFDSYMPGSGLLIWHIDDSVGNISDNNVNVNPSHLRVALEEADNNSELKTYGLPQGEATDAWKNSIDGFNRTSSPNSSYYNYTDTFVNVRNISNFAVPGDSINATLGYENRPPVLNITAPNSTSFWNSTHNITWTANDPDEDNLTYKLEYNNGTDWISINESFTTNESYYEWNVTNISEGLNYTLRMMVNDSLLAVNDTSDTFKIGNPPEVNLTYPAGGERINDTITINATVTDLTGQDDIDIVYFYYLVGSGNWTLLGNDTNSSDSLYQFTWNTSEVNDSLQYKINVTASDGVFNASDTSSYFIIDNINVAPAITITEPDEDDTWSGTKSITWTATDADNDTLTVKIEYFDSSWHTLINSTENDGTHSWKTTNVDDGDYKLRLTAKDSHNATDSETVEFTIQNEEEAGGGGGGFNEGIEPSLGDYSHTFSVITAGSSATWNLSSGSTVPVYSLSITPNVAVGDVTIGISNISSKPSSVTTPSGNVYSYFEVLTENLAESDLSSATLNFKIPVSWFTNTSYDPNAVTLYRNVNNVWVALTTTKVNADSSYYYYSAQTPGFSYFAITAKNLTAVQTEPRTNSGSSSGAAATQVNQTNQTKPVLYASAIPSTKSKTNNTAVNFADLSSISVSVKGRELIFSIIAGFIVLGLMIVIKHKIRPKHHVFHVKTKG